MSELRQDPIVNRWVIIAPDRALRPNSAQPQPTFVTTADDPFAEGHEAETPGELLADRAPGTAPDTPGWKVRVVPNKYPAVRSDLPAGGKDELFQRNTAALGAHEVIIECPHFETCLSRLSVEQVRAVLCIYRERLRFHRRHQTCAHALIFKNKGVAGGATLAHTHSQLIGTPWIPVALQEEFDACARYGESTGCNLFADLLARELSSGERIVRETERFIVLCPYASRVPGETWIVPRFDGSQFEAMTDTDLHETAELLRDALRRLDAVMPDLPYNYVLHSASIAPPEPPWYRWHIEILPRVGNIAGFEWGGGCYINSLPPETAARQLRAVV